MTIIPSLAKRVTVFLMRTGGLCFAMQRMHAAPLGGPRGTCFVSAKMVTTVIVRIVVSGLRLPHSRGVMFAVT